MAALTELVCAIGEQIALHHPKPEVRRRAGLIRNTRQMMEKLLAGQLSRRLSFDETF